MQILKTRVELENALAFIRRSNDSLGFVPTMGALHDGHISLLKKAQKENAYSIASIFVNPTQFNNPQDFSKYPRNLPMDTLALAEAKCDFLFAPSKEEIYPDNSVEMFDLGPVMQTLEGAFRPGHFQGVAAVVKRLLEIVQPTKSYFGLKDYQQFLVIKKLKEKYNLPSEIIGCEIIREKNGLAMSSRNQLLSASGREIASHLSKVLREMRIQYHHTPVLQLLETGKKQLDEIQGVRLEYLEVVDPINLEPVTLSKQGTIPAIALLAAHVEDVRLIDNMFLSFSVGSIDA